MDGNNESFHKWLNPIIIGFVGALLGVIWFMLQGQISSVGANVADLRLDARVLQTQNTEMSGTVKSLERRVQDLVDTLNRKK